MRTTPEAASGNTSIDAKWRNPPAAVAALDRERDRPQTPTELANNAIAWHQLSTRAQLNQKTPAVAIEQALRWRKEAAQRALAGPEAAKHYRSRLAGESFRTMPSDQFLREFPTYAGAVERLTSAARHASRQYTTAGDRDAFVLQARERLAQYIDDGRQFGRIEAREGTLAPSETRTRDNPRSR